MPAAPEDTDEVARVTGKVVAAGAPLLSRLGQRSCVYWDVREGLRDEPSALGKQDFWLENAEGRILVATEHVRVDARAQRGRQLLAVANADIVELAARLKEVKRLLRTEPGPGAAKLREEREHLAKVATFLHASRAHARGKVHLGGSARAQEEWIMANAGQVRGGPGAPTATLALDAWEVVIEEGQVVTVEGPCRIEAILPEQAAGDGYRTRPTGRVLRGSERSPLLVTGTGAIAPERTLPVPTKRSKKKTVPRAPLIRGLVSLVLLLAIMLFAFFAARGSR